MNIQELFDQPSEVISLPEGIYHGPVVIRHSCTIHGNNTTIWADTEPVILIKSPGVSIRSLCVRLRGKMGICIQTGFQDTYLSEIDVNGALRGFPDETEDMLPALFSVGMLAAYPKTNQVAFPLKAPASLRLSCTMRGVRLSANELAQGLNKLVLTISNIEDSRTLYGPVIASRAENAVIRRIYIFGEASSVAQPRELPEGYLSKVAARGVSLPIPAPSVHIRLDPPLPAEFDIEPFIFLLNDSRMVRGDLDLIFFRNPYAEQGGVFIRESEEQKNTFTRDGKTYRTPDKGEICLNLDQMSSAIRRILICFSIYGKAQGLFAHVRNRSLILEGKPGVRYYEFPLGTLPAAQTILGLELYRQGEKWQALFEGKKVELDQLCKRHGLDVQEG